MAFTLRGGIGQSDFQVAAAAVNQFRKNGADDGPSRPKIKSKQQVRKSMALRGRQGARARDAIRSVRVEGETETIYITTRLTRDE